MKNEELDIILEKSFKTKPDFNLQSDFAQKISSMIVRRELWKNDLFVSIVFILQLLLFGIQLQ